jgi:hypothetical protein
VKAPVECEGAPRDLGRDQGLACAASLREAFAAESASLRMRLRLGRASGPASELRRELLRHFPRQAETLVGIAAAARVPPAWLWERQLCEAHPGEAALAAAASAEVARAGAILGCALDGQWILRRSRPEGGFRCVELTRPWLAHALLGVNEAGLAAAVSSGGSAHGGAGAERTSHRSALLPAAPLASDCLQRFATLEACLEWCTARPADGPATLLFADAAGEIAGIELTPGHRRVLRSAEGWLAVGGSRDARERLAKALREGHGIDPALACADPATRTLCWQGRSSDVWNFPRTPDI